MTSERAGIPLTLIPPLSVVAGAAVPAAGVLSAGAGGTGTGVDTAGARVESGRAGRPAVRLSRPPAESADVTSAALPDANPFERR